MKFCEALNETLEVFNLSAKEISQASGVREATISEFRRGLKDIHTDNLERLLHALPQEAKQYLFLKVLVCEMDSKGLATLLNAVAYQLRREPSDQLGVTTLEPALLLKCS